MKMNDQPVHAGDKNNSHCNINNSLLDNFQGVLPQMYQASQCSARFITSWRMVGKLKRKNTWEEKIHFGSTFRMLK